MTVIATMWLIALLSLLAHIGLYFLLPWLRRSHQAHQEYKKALLQMAVKSLEDHAELGRMIAKTHDKPIDF